MVRRNSDKGNKIISCLLKTKQQHPQGQASGRFPHRPNGIRRAIFSSKKSLPIDVYNCRDNHWFPDWAKGSMIAIAWMTISSQEQKAIQSILNTVFQSVDQGRFQNRISRSRHKTRSL